MISTKKMTANVNFIHSIRAIYSSKASDHKNPLIRATVAKLVYSICNDIGNDRILSAETNQRTKKLIFEILAKLLIDKDRDTREFADKLCKVFKTHQQFVGHFIKSIESKQKKKFVDILSRL